MRPAPLSIQQNVPPQRSNHNKPALQHTMTEVHSDQMSSIPHTQSMDDVQRGFIEGPSSSMDAVPGRSQSVQISSVDTTQSNSSVSVTLSPLEPVVVETQSLESSVLRRRDRGRGGGGHDLFYRDIDAAMGDDQEWMADTRHPPSGFNDPNIPSFMLGPATVPPTPDKQGFGGGFGGGFGSGFGGGFGSGFGGGFGGADFDDDFMGSAKKVKSHNQSRHGVIPETPSAIRVGSSCSGSGASNVKSHFNETRTKRVVSGDEVKKRTRQLNGCDSSVIFLSYG